MASPHLVPSSAVIVPGREALLLEKNLDLNRIRLALRGQDAGIDAVLSAWHTAALLYAEATMHPSSHSGTSLVSDRNRGQARPTYSTADVAKLLNVTPRTVRKAAIEQRLDGIQDSGGNWRFTDEANAGWQARRKR